MGSHVGVHFSETRFCHVPLLSPVYRHSVCTDPKCRRTVRDAVALFDDCRIWSARSRVATTAFRLKLPDNGRCGFGLTAGSFVSMLMQTRFHSHPDPCHRIVHPTPVFAHVRARQSRNFISNNRTASATGLWVARHGPYALALRLPGAVRAFYAYAFYEVRALLITVHAQTGK